MKIYIYITGAQLAELTAICKARNVSRAEVIRETIDMYVQAERDSVMDRAFGIWKGEEDGLKYQRRIRDEW